ncbi:hypothetical protein GCM10028805_55240 [Spirosoma harenae]
MKQIIYSALPVDKIRSTRIFFFFLGLLFSFSSQAQTIRYVKPSTNGSGDGSSWSNATADLQGAINSLTATGGQVWVAAGLYKPTSTTARTISFTLKDNVIVYGGFAGSENTPSERPISRPSSSTLSGNIGDERTNADNSYHVVSCQDVKNITVLDGFVITRGNANEEANNQGGGLFSERSNIQIINCLFTANAASSLGGAAFINGNQIFPALGGMYSAKIVNCSFESNSASGGGGMFIGTSNSAGHSLRLLNCSFVSNTGGAIYIASGNASTEVPLINCSFQGNSAPSGAVVSVVSTSFSRSVARFYNCVLFGNGGNRTFRNDHITSFISIQNSLLEQTVTDYDVSTDNLITNTSPFLSANTTQLTPNSPAIDAGDPTSTTATSGTTDLAGNPRFVGGRIDMGAYEFQCSSSAVIGITSQPATNSTVAAGAMVTASVSATGAVSSYQWYKDGNTIVPGQNTATLSLTNVQPAAMGTYYAIVTGTCNSVTSTAFSLSVTAGPTPTSFTITGVTDVTCQTVSVGLRQLRFTPQYAGQTSDPISFSVVNELLPTTDPGPYTLNMYIDNPTIILKAQQGTSRATYVYDWLAACGAGSNFRIVGVTTIRCEIIEPNKRRLTFTPKYVGQTSDPISFSVANELPPTNASGPYILDLYIDNPIIRLQAQQGTNVTNYPYYWLAVCDGSGRTGIQEKSTDLQVKVLGNPVLNRVVNIEISGVEQQPVIVQLINLQGQIISEKQLSRVGSIERVSIPLDISTGMLVLQVSTLTQRQQVKLFRH